ncbi:MAG: DUF2892 domain-containing protein [Acidimicrobiia bacterium]
MNEASWDRIARVILGAVLLALGFAVVSGAWGVVLIVLGFVALITGATGFCPIYWITKYRTNHRDNQAAA